MREGLPVKDEDRAEAAAVLRRLLQALEGGDLEAPARVAHALTGAALALEESDGTNNSRKAPRKGPSG